MDLARGGRFARSRFGFVESRSSGGSLGRSKFQLGTIKTLRKKASLAGTGLEQDANAKGTAGQGSPAKSPGPGRDPTTERKQEHTPGRSRTVHRTAARTSRQIAVPSKKLRCTSRTEHHKIQTSIPGAPRASRESWGSWKSSESWILGSLAAAGDRSGGSPPGPEPRRGQGQRSVSDPDHERSGVGPDTGSRSASFAGDQTPRCSVWRRSACSPTQWLTPGSTPDSRLGKQTAMSGTWPAAGPHVPGNAVTPENILNHDLLIMSRLRSPSKSLSTNQTYIEVHHPPADRFFQSLGHRTLVLRFEGPDQPCALQDARNSGGNHLSQHGSSPNAQECLRSMCCCETSAPSGTRFA